MRLLAFLARHPAGRSLLSRFMERLPSRDRAFLEVLQSSNERRLTPRERVRLHRIERQFWINQYAEMLQKSLRLPLEVELFILRELQKVGLYAAVERRLSELQRTRGGNPLAMLQILWAAYFLKAQRGASPKLAVQMLGTVRAEAMKVVRTATWQRFQLYLMRLIKRAGRIPLYQKEGERTALWEHPIWRVSPLNKEEEMMRIHSRGLLLMLEGRWEESAACFEEILQRVSPDSYIRVSSCLNLWITSLYQPLSPERIEEVILPLTEKIPIQPAYKSLLLHHTLRTVWLYGNSSLMGSYYRGLRAFCAGVPHDGELQVALAAIARGAGWQAQAALHYGHAQLPRFSLPTRFEAYFGRFLIAIEEQNLRNEFRKVYCFLLRNRYKLPNSELFIQFMRLIAQPHISYSRLHTLWQEWQSPRSHQQEGWFLWYLTPFPVWTACLLRQKPLEAYLSQRAVPTSLFATLERIVEVQLGLRLEL